MIALVVMETARTEHEFERTSADLAPDALKRLEAPGLLLPEGDRAELIRGYIVDKTMASLEHGGAIIGIAGQPPRLQMRPSRVQMRRACVQVRQSGVPIARGGVQIGRADVRVAPANAQIAPARVQSGIPVLRSPASRRHAA